jgi:hypothetical protein
MEDNTRTTPFDHYEQSAGTTAGTNDKVVSTTAWTYVIYSVELDATYNSTTFKFYIGNVL